MRTYLAAVCMVTLVASACASGEEAEKETDGAEQAKQEQVEQKEKQKRARKEADKQKDKARREGKKMEEGKQRKAQKMQKMMEKMMKRDKSQMPSDKDVRATVEQPEGQVTYWVTPGPRQLDDYFGTKQDPKLTADVPEGAPKPVKQLVEKVPILIGVPEDKRTYRDGKAFTSMPTPFGDEGVPVEESSLELTYIDRQSEDKKGPPIKTADEVEADIEFTDPEGNSYEIEPLLVFQPPIPGYKTQGGVMTDDTHHGTTGTGTPLMPEVYTWGANWMLSNIKVNGEVADKRKVTHCMTTETVRKSDYALALSDDLPLAKDETIAGQMHHTHCIVLPIQMTPEGPKHDPVKTAFELPNGKNQPFIHIMYENDELGDGLPWNGPTGDGSDDGDGNE